MLKNFLLNNDILVKNIYSNFINNLTLLINRFFQITVFLFFIDKSLYSLWILVVSMTSLFTFFDLGIINFIGNLLLKHKNKGNSNFYLKYLYLGKRVIHIASLVIFLILILFFLYFNTNFIGINDINSNLFKFILIFFTIGIIIQNYIGYYFQVLRANDKMYIATYIISFVNLVQLIFIFLSLFISNNLLITAFVYNVCFLISFFLLYKKVKDLDLINNKNNKINSFRFIFIKKVFKGSFSYLFISINHLVLNFIPILTLKKYFSEEILVDFFIYKSFVLYALQFMNIFFYSFQPELNKLYFSNNFNKKKLNSLLDRLFLILLLLIIGTYLFSFIFGELLFAIWTNNKTIIDYNLLSIFLIFIVIRLMWSFIMNFLQSINYLLITSIAYSIFSLIFFIIIIIFARKFEFLNFCKIILFSEFILLLFLNLIILNHNKIYRLFFYIKQSLLLILSFIVFFVYI